MARSARALAQSHSPALSLEPAALSRDSVPIEAAAGPPPAGPSGAASLALRACDEATSLREVQHALRCIEKLIAPVHLEEGEEVHATRSELGALVRLVHEELDRRVDRLAAAIRSTQEALREAATQ